MSLHSSLKESAYGFVPVLGQGFKSAFLPVIPYMLCDNLQHRKMSHKTK